MKKTLKDTCEFFNGTGFPISFQGQSVGKYPFYKVGDISKNVQQGYKYLEVCENYINDDIVSQLKGTIIPANSIVFAKIGEALKLNRRAITKQPSLIDNNAIAIHPNKELLDVDYFFYFMKTVNLADYSSSTTVPSVKKSALDKIQLTVPSILTQKDIANELNCISDAISIAKSRLLSLDELIKSRFIEMFGNPVVENKWDLHRWSDVLEIRNGKDYKKNLSNKQSGYPVYGSGGFMNIYADTYLCEGIITIIGRKGNINNPLLVEGKIWNVDTAFGIIVNTKVLNPLFFYHRSKLYDYEKMNNATTIPSLTKSELLKLEIGIPPIELQNKFAEFVKLIDKSKFIVQQQIKDLEELLDSKMDEYFR